MKPEENPLEPSFWEALGITMIVLDDSTPESFQTGIDELVETIEDQVAIINLSSELEDK